MEEIIIRANNQFKSKVLNTATTRLYKAFQSMENGRKDACVILANVEKNKSYKEDGFASLADYAAEIGLDKSLAHKMENAGRLLISEDSTIKDFASKADYSKLSILSSAPVEEVKKAIESGELSDKTTQADVKAWKATKALQSKKEAVLPKFEVFGVYGNGNTFHYDSIELENVTEIEGLAKVGTFELGTSTEGNTKWTVYASHIDGTMVRITYTKVKKAGVKKAKDAKDITKEELIALAEKLGMKVSF